MERAVATECPSTVRGLNAFEREGIRICRSDWVMVTINHGDAAPTTVVGRISEMVQVNTCMGERVVSVVRIIIEHVVKPVFDADSTVTVIAEGDGQRMYVPVESAHISYMARCSGEVRAGVVRLRLP